MTLTSRVTNENNLIVAWVDSDNVAWIEQPFNPADHEDWSSEEEAKDWADNWIVEFNNRPESTPLA
jgi:hypothetical protein